MPIITLSFTPGIYGEELARRLSEKLGIELISRAEIMRKFLCDLTSEYGIELLDRSPKFYLSLGKNKKSLKDNLKIRAGHFADGSNAVTFGIAPALFLEKHPSALNVLLFAKMDYKKAVLADEEKISEEEAESKIESYERLQKRFGKILFETDTYDLSHYELSINMERVNTDAAVSIISELYRFKQTEEFLINSTAEEKKVRIRDEVSTLMKNDSEVEFARVLDMYNLRWVYEPKTFPLEWDENGVVTNAFSPDFYLPEYDLYLELTVMNPKYSSEKKKKTRLIEKLYPGTKVKLVQRKDFEHLLRSLNDKSAMSILRNNEDYSDKGGYSDEAQDSE